MNNYTTDLYEIKRENINFSKKLTNGLGQVESKFITEMIYGITKSQSIILSNISDALHETIKKINTVERLSRNLDKELSKEQLYCNYMNEVNKVIHEEPVVLVDDSDVIKPHGKIFESLGLVRDASSLKNNYEKGYHVTEMVVLTKHEKQPISVYSHIHSSHEKNYKSTNEETFRGIDQILKYIKKRCTFVFDRGYDSNNLILKVLSTHNDFVLRLTEKRNLIYKGKKYKSTVLRDSRKGKIKMNVMFQGVIKECYISQMNVRISASKKEMRLVLVYGLGEVPMMLLTNKNIKSKEEAIKIVNIYMSRWRIEDYFRFKKQEFGFENFRVRSLQSINNLNQLLSYAIGFIGLLTEKMDKKLLVIKVLERANVIRTKCIFYYTQMIKGIGNILSHAKTGIKEFLNIRLKQPYKQIQFKLSI
ncbi:MAG: hypothetical protein K0Q49_2376 [Haloplasmataceae bacterium]|nr:hypothetical protein [Haloplasmataceae bacterium]